MPDTGGLLREIEGLDPILRQAIASSWADAALDEHASVASFARFSLHLLAVAAPPDLLVAAHRAGLDEIAHARACFEIAGAYAGEALSPGPLRLSGDLLGPLDLASIAAAAVIEGCVGETVASLEAREAAATARPEPAPRPGTDRRRRGPPRRPGLALRGLGPAGGRTRGGRGGGRRL